MNNIILDISIYLLKLKVTYFFLVKRESDDDEVSILLNFLSTKTIKDLTTIFKDM